MKRDDQVYLKHILDAIQRIEQYLKGFDYSSFLKNPLVQDGVIRQTEIIGEAAKRVSAETKKKASIIPWKDVAGMRDKLAHEYFGVDLEVVWKTAQYDIPPLKKQVGALLRTEK